MSPGEVVWFTDLALAKSTYRSAAAGWNEVTVLGPLINVVGIFLRLEKDGSLKKKSNGEPVLPMDTLRAVRACWQANHAPIVDLLDSRDA